MKTCNKCQRELADIAFSPRTSWCKYCMRAYAKEYRARNKDKIAGYFRVRQMIKNHQKIQTLLEGKPPCPPTPDPSGSDSSSSSSPDQQS